MIDNVTQGDVVTAGPEPARRRSRRQHLRARARSRACSRRCSRCPPTSGAPPTSRSRASRPRPSPAGGGAASPDEMTTSAPGVDAAPAVRVQRAGRSPLARRRRRAGLLFTLPVVALVGSLLLYPIGQTFYYSFTNWDGFDPAQWIGFAAYQRLFANPEFVSVLENNGLIVARDPGRGRHPARRRLPDQHPRARLAVLPLGVLPARRPSRGS